MCLVKCYPSLQPSSFHSPTILDTPDHNSILEPRNPHQSTSLLPTMQPPSPFYARYAPAPMLSHPGPVPASLPHPTSHQISHAYPSTSSAPSYVYSSQYASPYPPHASVAYSPYVTHPSHASFVPAAHGVPSVHLQAPPVLAGAPAMYGPAPTQPTRAPAPPAYAPPSPESCERDAFYRKLHAFRDSMGDPIQRLPTLGFKELDLWVLYNEVVKRRGIDAVIAKKQWKEVAEALQLPSSCTDSGFRLRLHYKKYLEAFERKYFDPPESVSPRSSGKESTSPSVKAEPKSPAVKKAESKTMEKAPSSVTSSGSAPTEAGDIENESAGTVSNGSNGSDSRRSSGGSGGVSRAEATSKGEGMRKARGIVKKKKRSVGNGVTGLKKQDVQDKGEGKVKKGKDESEEVRRPVSCPKQSNGLPKQTQDAEMHVERQPKRPEKQVEEKEAAVRRKPDGKGPCGSKGGVNRKAGDEKKVSVLFTARKSQTGSSRDSKPSVAKGISKGRGNRVDFSVLDSATLKRYARVHGVGCDGESAGKKGLAERVAAHFSATPVRGGETATVLRFIQAVRRR